MESRRVDSWFAILCCHRILTTLVPASASWPISRRIFSSASCRNIRPQHKANKYLEINRTLTKDEYDEITEYALDLGLENAFVQEIESQTACLPDFEQANPFNFT